MSFNPYQSPLLSNLTTAQIRDRWMLALLPFDTPAKELHRIKIEYMAEKERRAKSSDYVECPRCREHHGDLEAYQGICAMCAETLLFEHPNNPIAIELERARGFTRKS